MLKNYKYLKKFFDNADYIVNGREAIKSQKHWSQMITILR